MKRVLPILFLVSFLLPQSGIAQNDKAKDSLYLDYREDQFYFGVTYNLLRQLPDGVTQNGFSSGFHLGLIRDMPISAKRNVAIGLGLGYSGNSINQNIRISKDNSGESIYDIVENGTFSKNKIALHFIEVPLEFRWRTSTPDDYRFWRIYAGVKFGYIIASSSKYQGDLENLKLNELDNLNKFQYGLMLTAGYDKFNAHLYYALNSIFDSEVKINANALDISVIRIGLMLYIL